MFKQLLGISLALLATAGTVQAQRGGGGHGGGMGGGHGGYGGYGGYGRGGYGGYGRGFYGGGFYGGWGYPYYYGGIYPYYGGGFYDLPPAVGTYPSTVIPYSSNYTPIPPANVDPSTLPSLPAPLSPPSIPNAVATKSATPATATVSVIVPEGAQVWFDNTLTPTKGTKWTYTSPKLEPSKTYTVNVKARWAEGGQDKAYDIPLRIVAGDNMTMDLTKVR